MFAYQSNTSCPAALNALVLAVLDSLEASMCAELREIRDSAIANIRTAMDSTVAEIRRDLALGDGEDSTPAPMFSDYEESHDLSHSSFQGDNNLPKIPSTIEVNYVPPLLSLSPLLRATATSSLKP
ncbi:hypothetical protein D8674_019009 [Pyrus ussuriensis x Pyrus communis]|uniref:Uncharacterized protein n=1 Tax=Pyrus ussuriensis x Pyrus communis TaxID=2448454 RepID=A0A5N5G718_9ROSA|nr:hypothetical protein D8674_019009 [Pyrus ussuriensis x Pyrus communis]